MQFKNKLKGTTFLPPSFPTPKSHHFYRVLIRTLPLLQFWHAPTPRGWEVTGLSAEGEMRLGCSAWDREWGRTGRDSDWGKRFWRSGQRRNKGNVPMRYQSTGRFSPCFFVNSSAFLKNFLRSFEYSSARSALSGCSGWGSLTRAMRDWITGERGGKHI